jgi:hypothetical protein
MNAHLTTFIFGLSMLFAIGSMATPADAQVVVKVRPAASLLSPSSSLLPHLLPTRPRLSFLSALSAVDLCESVQY